MHLNDAFGQSGLKIWCMHHEQSCAMAAEACTRTSGVPAVINVTTGPGSINALNGVFGAWTDSIPMIVISGQVKRETMRQAATVPLRQMGDQEGPTDEFAKACCKAVVVLNEPDQARAVVQKAWAIATAGRPGPVWIDVPVDVQGALVKEEDLKTVSEGWFIHPSTLNETNCLSPSALLNEVEELVEELCQAKRPLIVLGMGARLSEQTQAILDFCAETNIGVVGGWGSYDQIPTDHPSYCGKPGTVGDRAGNIAVQGSDFVLVLGARLNIRQVSYAWDNFAKNAIITQVDIDSGELNKPISPKGRKVHSNLSDFWPLMASKVRARLRNEPSTWAAWPQHCQAVVAAYPAAKDARNAPRLQEGSGLSPYDAVEALSARLPEGAVVVTGNGTVSVAGMQSSTIKKKQRWIANSGSASMGYDLPAAFGAWVGLGGETEVICLAGDGSAMMNIQDLHTWSYHHAKIRGLLFDNKGYHSIRQTQLAYFKESPVGYEAENGIGFPDLERVAKAFGCASRTVDEKDAQIALNEVFELPAPCLAILNIDPGIPFAPKLASRKLADGTMISPSLEDMWPFLTEEEMKWARGD